MCVNLSELSFKHLWRKHQEKISDNQNSELDLDPEMEHHESCDISEHLIS